MKSLLLTLVLRLIAKLAVEDIWPVIRAALVQRLEQSLLGEVERVVAEVDNGQMSGEQKAEWARETLNATMPKVVERTPSHLVNLAIEYAVGKLRARG